VTLQRKNERESALLGELSIQERRAASKQAEVDSLQRKMVFYETFKHKFDTKKRESEKLLQRVEALS